MRRVLTPKWMLVHAGVLITVAGFLALGWWQVSRAIAGNILSFGYAFEWPVFAGFLIFVWTREIRRALPESTSAGAANAVATNAVATNAVATNAVATNAGATHAGAATSAGAHDSGGRRGGGYRGRTGPAYDDSGDASLAAYNHYLAWLNAHPHASPADYPG